MTRRVALGPPETWPALAAEAAVALQRDEVVVLPAEGLYGYHALAARPDALAALQRMKPREPGRGWITLVANLDEAKALASFPPQAETLARAHWPGALTLVLPVAPGTDSALAASDSTIALRSPGHAFLRQVLAAVGGAIVTSSANRPGEPPPDELDRCALEGIAWAVDAGPLSGLPSTIVRVRAGRVEVLRAGAVQVVGEST